MIYASDFRKGRTFQINGEPHVVLDFMHVKPGKGAAFVEPNTRTLLQEQPEKKLSIRMTSSKKLLSKPRRCSTCTTTEIFTILWIRKLMNRFRLLMIW